jgi:parvulin-like peptidyl-prolyl isomerase
MTNNFRSLAFALVVAAAAASVPACRAGRRPPAGASARPPGAAGEAIARVGDLVITVADVQNRINAQPPVVRSQYGSLDKKKQLVTDLVNFEMMAAEAVRRGYDRDPDVVRIMKQQMIGKLVQKDLEAKVKIDDASAADIQRYYDEHVRDFSRPEQVQVSQILIKDRARAARVAAEARALPRQDAKAFRDLVSRYSEDQDSKTRGGDMVPFDRGSAVLPEAVVRAAFALKTAGEITEPVPTEEGFRILRLAARVPGYSRPLTDVTAQIRQQLIQAARAKAVTDFVAGLRAQYPVAIDERNLAKVTIDTTVSSNKGIEPRRRRGLTPGVPGL